MRTFVKVWACIGAGVVGVAMLSLGAAVVLTLIEDDHSQGKWGDI